MNANLRSTAPASGAKPSAGTHAGQTVPAGRPYAVAGWRTSPSYFLSMQCYCRQAPIPVVEAGR